MTEVGVVLEKFWLGMALHLWQTTLILAVLLILGLGLRRAPARYSNTLGWLPCSSCCCRCRCWEGSG